MTETDARELYRWLARLLDEVGLGELVQSVEAYLRQGKTVERDIALYEEPTELGDEAEPSEEPYGGRRRRGPRPKYFGVSEYNAPERVRILIEAVLHRVVYAQLVEHDAWVNLDVERPGVANAIRLDHIVLASESEGEEPLQQSLRREFPIQQLRRLQEILEGLRDEVRR